MKLELGSSCWRDLVQALFQKQIHKHQRQTSLREDSGGWTSGRARRTSSDSSFWLKFSIVLFQFLVCCLWFTECGSSEEKSFVVCRWTWWTVMCEESGMFTSGRHMASEDTSTTGKMSSWPFNAEWRGKEKTWHEETSREEVEAQVVVAHVAVEKQLLILMNRNDLSGFYLTNELLV